MKLLEVPNDIKERYKAQAEQCSVDLILLGLDLLKDAEYNFKGSKNKRLHIEVAIMKLSSIKANLEKKKV